jgi:hypothetical protein
VPGSRILGYQKLALRTRNLALDGLMNIKLGEGLPRSKAAAVQHEDNTPLPQHEVIGRYVSCIVTRSGVAEDILCP